MPGAESANILVVCTGNICRSPFMQFSLAAALESAGLDDVSVTSAGTRAVPASGVAPAMASLLAADGLDASGFSTHQLTRQLVTQADIVLTAERAHRKEVLQLDPGALRRTFTLLQFERLLPAATLTGRHRAEESTRARLLTLIERCAAARATSGPSGAGDDVPDPWGLSADVYRRAADLMRPAVGTIANALVPHSIGTIN